MNPQPSLYEIIMLSSEIIDTEQLDLGPAVEQARRQAADLLAYAEEWDALALAVRDAAVSSQPVQEREAHA